MNGPTPPPDGIVTLRELYALIGTTRAELGAEIRDIKAHVDNRLIKHEQEHREEERMRSNRVRWAVTTILAVLGTGAAIVIPLLTKG